MLYFLPAALIQSVISQACGTYSPIVSTDPESNYFRQNVSLFCGYTDVTQAWFVDWRIKLNSASSFVEIYYADNVDDTNSEPAPDFVGYVDGKFVNVDNTNHSLILIDTLFDESTFDCLVRTAQCTAGEYSNKVEVKLKGKLSAASSPPQPPHLPKK